MGPSGWAQGRGPRFFIINHFATFMSKHFYISLLSMQFSFIVTKYVEQSIILVKSLHKLQALRFSIASNTKSTLLVTLRRNRVQHHQNSSDIFYSTGIALIESPTKVYAYNFWMTKVCVLLDGDRT